MKLREIREAYEELSGSFSKTARTLALSGIAIAWFFMPYFKEHRLMISLSVMAICTFVVMILADLLQNYILSKKWYNFYITMKDVHRKDEEDEVKEDEDKNKIGWLLYDAKFYLLIIGYLFLVFCFVAYLMKIK